MDKIIEIKNLNKSFKDVKAVKNLSFDVARGQLFAFLGLNGAGKSTTISIMCGLMPKDSGQILIDGIDIDKGLSDIKGKLGVVYQFSSLDKSLSVIDNLKIRASLYGIKGENFEVRMQELDELLHFKYLFKRTFGKLSGGERRRVDIARALLHKPSILILDEPTTGLDPQTRKMVWDAISHLQKTQNMTLFLTTHYMEEANNADYIIILDGGQIAGRGTPIDLKNEYTCDYITLYNAKESDVKKLKVPYVFENSSYRINVENTKFATDLIVKYPKVFVDYEIVKGNMDDVFLNVTGKKLGGEQ